MLFDKTRNTRFLPSRARAREGGDGCHNIVGIGGKANAQKLADLLNRTVCFCPDVFRPGKEQYVSCDSPWICVSPQKKK